MSNIFVNLTCEPENKVNIRDRVIFKESVTFRSEVAVTSAEKTTYKFTFPIVELLKVLDENGKQYDCTNLNTENRDIDVSDGEAFWVTGRRRPPEGVPFSVQYSFYPAYDVITAAHEVRGFVAGKLAEEGGRQVWEDLPRLFTAKLVIPDAYLFG